MYISTHEDLYKLHDPSDLHPQHIFSSLMFYPAFPTAGYWTHTWLFSDIKEHIFLRLAPFSVTSWHFWQPWLYILHPSLLCVYWHDFCPAGSFKKAIGNNLLIINVYRPVVLWTIALWSSKMWCAFSQQVIKCLVQSEDLAPFASFPSVQRV